MSEMPWHIEPREQKAMRSPKGRMQQEFSELDRSEDVLVREFRSHSFLKGLPNISGRVFRKILLQRYHTSMNSSRVLEYAINTLSDGQCKNVARRIRDEEYPSGRPSQGENFYADLRAFGLSESEIHTSGITMDTHAAMNRLVSEVNHRRNRHPQDDDIRITTTLRMHEEILASEEHALFLDRMEKMGFDRSRSRFFQPHRIRGRKQAPMELGSSALEPTRADLWTVELRRLLESTADFRHCRETAVQALRIRSDFFKQFDSRSSNVEE